MADYLGYKAATRLGPHTRLATRLEVARAVDQQAPRSIRIHGRHAGFTWKLGVSLIAGLAGRRSDRRDSAGWLIRQLGADAGRRDAGLRLSDRAGWCALSGRSVTTYKEARSDLEAAGALVTVHQGCKRWDEHGNTRNDAAVYALVLPRQIIRKIAAARRAASPRPLNRPPRSSGNCLLQIARAASPDLRERDGPPYDGRAHPPRPRNAQLPAGAGAAAAMARLLRHAAGQDLTDGWCGWFARRYLAAGWTPDDLAGALAAVPPREQWHRALRTLPPQVALMFWLRQTPARHWLDDWLAMKPGPARVRARAARAARLAQQRREAGRQAAAARPPEAAAAIASTIAGLRARMGWGTERKPGGRAARPLSQDAPSDEGPEQEGNHDDDPTRL